MNRASVWWRCAKPAWLHHKELKFDAEKVLLLHKCWQNSHTNPPDGYFCIFCIFTFSLGIPIMDRDCNEQISLFVLWREKHVQASQNFSRFCLCYFSLFSFFLFSRECLEKFGDDIGTQVWDAVNDCFDVMPLAATVDDRVSWGCAFACTSLAIGWVWAVPLCAQI